MDTWHPHGNQWELKKDARVLLLLWIPFLEGAFALSEIVQPEISPSDTVYDFQICTTMLDNVHASLETGFSVLQCPPETPPPLPPHRRFNLDRITPKAANVASIPTEFTELVPHHSFPSSGFCLHDNIDASSRLDSLYVKTLNARPTPSRLQPPAYYPLFFLPVLFRFGWFTVQPRRPSSDLILTDLGSYLKRNTDSLI
ncbi:hypothetical protein POX_b02657 [Penicillium oxalicum]|uniref:hypothetical protein n=1 Tax=Penicillium oxalicum TaxID=69781 RepID=UPI0020B8F94D|nr:hypothetical protein POX_b02657 [Penicillium oxalicum]KAI2792618.1 hypothetical protein POX_b02657 [Penicillium oxalicum]